MSNSRKFEDANALYDHVAFGLRMVSGSDLNYMDKEVSELGLTLAPEDQEILTANWKVVRARLEANGYV